MSLFHNRLVALFHNFQKKAIVSRFQAWTTCIEAPADGQERIPLSSSQVRSELEALTQIKHFRIRIAMPVAPPAEIANQATVELYSDEGIFLKTLAKVKDLGEVLAAAVEDELLDMLQPAEEY